MSTAAVRTRADGALEVSGELTFATVPAVLAANNGKFTGAGALTVDLAGVSRADSAGVALLVEWLRLARRAGRELRYVNMPRQTEQLIRVSGLERVFALA
jgi:phospholipid transport system transporter-binding protein